MSQEPQSKGDEDLVPDKQDLNPFLIMAVRSLGQILRHQRKCFPISTLRLVHTKTLSSTLRPSHAYTMAFSIHLAGSDVLIQRGS